MDYSFNFVFYYVYELNIYKNKFHFIFIKYSYAASAALQPSPAAEIICFAGPFVTSPAAKTPGTFVSLRQLIIISLRAFISRKPFAKIVLGIEPISMNTPCTFIVFSPPLNLFLIFMPETNLPPDISVTSELLIISRLFFELNLSRVISSPPSS